MKKLFLALLLFTGATSLSFAQGAFIPPQTALKNINGIVMPIANATVTVCAANAGGIPCTTPLLNTIFKDGALTQPLPNPFTTDANGNYQFAVSSATATYTVTVTAAGFAGQSYQVTVGTGSGGGNVITVNGGAPIGSPTNLVNGTNVTITNPSGNNVQFSASGGGGGGGGGGSTLDNCTPDESGNSFYSVLSLTNYFDATWEFVPGAGSAIYCAAYSPAAATGATIVLDVAANDGTAGHTASFQTCDGVINSGTINTGSLTCASAQTFTTTSTAYNRVSLTFNVQSTVSAGSWLVFKILTSTSGTQPTANMLVYPHLVGIGGGGGGGGSAVNSVLNTDNTLTISPTTGSVVASLNLLNPNTWGGLQTMGTNISIGGVTATGATGTGNVVFSASPHLTGTPAGPNGNLTQTIANGTAALGTSAILSGTCAPVVTASASGVLSTDTVDFTPNASIKAVTGYAPSTSGGLSIAAYPTANNVNFDVCNWSSSSITPGAVTLNWRVPR